MLITVLLADDSPLIRKAIRNFLRDDPEIRVVAEASNFRQTIRFVKDFSPHVIVLDVYMGRGSAPAPPEVRSSLAESKVLAISFSNDDDTKALAYSFGAIECLDKSKLAEELVPAIKRWIKA
jgi:two-component system response regulator DctR